MEAKLKAIEEGNGDFIFETKTEKQNGKASVNCLHQTLNNGLHYSASDDMLKQPSFLDKKGKYNKLEY